MANKLNWEKSGVYWKYSGEVSGQEIIDASRIVYGDPRFDELEYKLVDFSDAQAVNMSDKEVARIAFQHKAAELSNACVKNAIVMMVNIELAEKFASFFVDSTWEVEVFQDIDAANKWLGREAA